MNLYDSQKPLVSVVIRTINRPGYLRECLESIEFQDYENLEVILVNDGGPSLTPILSEFGFRRPHRIVEFRSNRGRAFAANQGLDEARGDYICFLDDDDIFYPHHLSTLVGALDRSQFSVAYSDALRADQVANPLDPGKYETMKTSLVYSQDYEYPMLLKDNFIPILCVLFHRSCLDTKVRFDETLDVLEDWDFWIRLGQHFPFHHVREITCEFRMRDDGSNTTGQMQLVWESCRTRLYARNAELLSQVSSEGKD